MKISYTELKQCTEELYDSVQNINQILEEVAAVKNSITKSECWTGTACDYYIGKIKKLSENFDDVYLELEKTAKYLGQIVMGYEGVDKKVTEIIDSFNFTSNSFKGI